MRGSNSCRFLAFSTSIVLIAMTGLVAQAAPTLSNLSLRGLQIGGTTTITLTGRDLLPAPRVVLAVPIAKQTVKPGGKANRVEIEITLDDKASVGIYSLRVANAKGISNSLAVGIDRLVQQPFSTSAKLPTAMHGNVGGNQILRATFAGKKGQSIVADVESRRLGSNLRPVVRLYDTRGSQIAWSGPKATLSGDARCQAVLPTDGDYTLELHDMLYRGSGFFRLKLGTMHYSDMVFPLGVQQGSKTSLQPVSSNLPDNTRIEFDASSHSIGYRPALSVATLTGSAPPLAISSHPEAVEAVVAKGQQQSLGAAPVAVSGRLAQTGEEDQFALDVTPGQKLRFEVWARRVGSPVDGVLSIRGEKGNQLATNDDRPGVSDPGLNYTVPKNVKKLVVALRDLNGGGGESFVYRIAVDDLSRGDFSLSIDTDRINIPVGGTQIARVQVKRAGYNGPIKLAVEGLPSNVRLGGELIPAGANVGLLSLTAAAGSPAAGLARITATASNSATPMVRVAQLAETTVSRRQPWLRSQLGLAVTGPSPINVTWTPQTETKLVLGSRLPTSVKLTRAAGTKGDIRVRLLTTQVVPQKTVRQGNQNKKVNDLDRTLRLDGNAQFAAAASDAGLTVFVPADLPQTTWTVAMVAELLSADKKTVVASAYSPVYSLAAQQALKIELAGKNTINGTAGDGETGKFTGKIIRTAGFSGPVTVTVEGFRGGYAVPKMTVPADQSQFELPVRFKYGARQADLAGARLVASMQTDPKNPKSTIRSNAIGVTVKVVPGTKPAAKK